MDDKENFRCFLVQLSPFSDRATQDVKDFQEDSLSRGIAGMGWANNSLFIKYPVGISINDNEVLCKFSKKDVGISKAFNAYKRINIGDYLLTRKKGCEDCYIGKVTQAAARFDDDSRYSWGVYCD